MPFYHCIDGLGVLESHFTKLNKSSQLGKQIATNKAAAAGAPYTIYKIRTVLFIFFSVKSLMYLNFFIDALCPNKRTLFSFCFLISAYIT